MLQRNNKNEKKMVKISYKVKKSNLLINAEKKLIYAFNHYSKTLKILLHSKICY